MSFTFGNYQYMDDIIEKLPLAWQIVFSVIALAVCILSIVSMWKVFVKAGEKGWKALIPFYNMYTLFKLCWETKQFWTYLILTIVVSLTNTASGAFADGTAGNIVFYIASVVAGAFLIYLDVVLMLNLAKAFGKGNGFGIGLVLLEVIFIAILAFDKSKYVGNPTQPIQNENPIDNENNE